MQTRPKAVQVCNLDKKEEKGESKGTRNADISGHGEIPGLMSPGSYL